MKDNGPPSSIRHALLQCRDWFFAPTSTPITWWRVIAWWELRRIPFNLIVGSHGIVCLLIFFWAITTSGKLPPGEDAVEPIALVLAPFGINVCYTLGWMVELLLRLLLRPLSPRTGPILLALGLAFSLFVISIPAVLWAGFRLLQWLGVFH